MSQFKITKKCIRCYGCTRIAEDNFRMEEHTAVIYKQPNIDYEIEECQTAMARCPIKAIEQV